MRKRMIRIFISSTFQEFSVERDRLQHSVFPKLEKICRENGFSFEIIDLRWGVSEQNARDNRTVEICFEEIRRCQELSPCPNFLIMTGNRYGWRPLPFYIPEEEWQILTTDMTEEEKGVLNTEILENGEIAFNPWYQKDENDLLGRYVLRPRTGRYEDQDAWNLQEDKLRRCLFAAADRHVEQLGGDALRKYGLSATEQEIFRGFLDPPEAKEHTFVLMKCWWPLPVCLTQEEKELAEASASVEAVKTLGRWYSVQEDGTWRLSAEWSHNSQKTASFSPGRESEEERLRSCLYIVMESRRSSGTEAKLSTEEKIFYGWSDKKRVPSEFSDLDTPQAETVWLTKSGYDRVESPDVTESRKALLDECALRETLKNEMGDRAGEQIFEYPEGSMAYEERIEAFLERIIRREIQKAGPIENGKDEIQILKDELKRVDELYVQRVTSDSGNLDTAFDNFCKENRGRAVLVSGISGVGKSWFLKHWAYHNREKCVYFFTDVIPSLNSAIDAFSFCLEQLVGKGRLKEIDRLDDRVHAGVWLEKQLSRITEAGEPLVLIIDCVEGLSDWNASTLSFFEMELPQNVTIVISCIEKTNAVSARAEIPEFQLTGMNSLNAVEMLRCKLAQRNRKLTDEQIKWIGTNLTEKCTPLAIDVLTDFCGKWKSSDLPNLMLEPANTFSQGSLVRRWLETRGSGGYAVLYRHALIYLSLARDGLSEQEILKLLTNDPDVEKNIQNETEKIGAGWTYDKTISIPSALWAMVFYEIRGSLSEALQNGVLLLRFKHQCFYGEIAKLAGEEKTRELAARMRDYFWPDDVKTGMETASLRNLRESYHLHLFLKDELAIKQLLENPYYADGCIRYGMYGNLTEQLCSFVRNCPQDGEKIVEILKLLWSHAVLFQAFSDSYLSAAAGAGLISAIELERRGKTFFLSADTQADTFDAMQVDGVNFAISDDGILAALADGYLYFYDMNTRVALESVCNADGGYADLYWKKNILTFRGQYVRIRYELVNGRISEISREACVGSTHLLDPGDAKFKEAGGYEEAESVCEVKVFGGKVHYIRRGRICAMQSPIDTQKNLKVRACGHLAAFIIDKTLLQVFDLDRKLLLSEYQYLMIRDVRWAPSGEKLLLILTNGRVALVDADARQQEVEKPYREMEQTRLGWGTILKPDGVMVFVFEQGRKRGKTIYCAEDQVDEARKPLYAAFLTAVGKIACYYRYAGESIVRLYDMDGTVAPQTWLTDPIYQEDASQTPFYAEDGGKKLVLISGGIEHILDAETGNWLHNARKVQAEEEKSLGNKLRENYAVHMEPWFPKQWRMEAAKTKKKTLTDRMSDGLIWLVDKASDAYRAWYKPITAAEMVKKRLISLRLEEKMGLIWMADTEYGILSVYDKDGTCICREQVNEKILAYQQEEDGWTILKDGTFSVERIRLHSAFEAGNRDFTKYSADERKKVEKTNFKEQEADKSGEDEKIKAVTNVEEKIQSKQSKCEKNPKGTLKIDKVKRWFSSLLRTILFTSCLWIEALTFTIYTDRLGVPAEKLTVLWILTIFNIALFFSVNYFLFSDPLRGNNKDQKTFYNGFMGLEVSILTYVVMRTAERITRIGFATFLLVLVLSLGEWLLLIVRLLFRIIRYFWKRREGGE